MPGSEHCRFLPTIEGCQATAERIENLCLRDCVIRLCRVGKPSCTKAVQLRCAVRTSQQAAGDSVGGWVLDDRPRSCTQPKEEVDWCQVPRSPRCQEMSMVHELAHACGWHHGEGQGVPGDEGRLVCR